jgi:GT2 family glycosyltransferase
MASGDFFCVMNPDIRIHENPFPVLLEGFFDASIGVVAPMVVGPDGAIEDSARKFPSPLKILLKALGQKPPQDYEMVGEFVQPEWVGGMFMLFKRTAFAKLQGFDQRYFLYYEDVDICARVHLSNHKVLLCLNAKVTHNAQRSSHRSFKFLRWHIFSMLRFFLSDVYWRVQLGKLRGLSKN